MSAFNHIQTERDHDHGDSKQEERKKDEKE